MAEAGRNPGLGHSHQTPSSVSVAQKPLENQEKKKKEKQNKTKQEQQKIPQEFTLK